MRVSPAETPWQRCTLGSYLRHDRPPIFALDIAKRHFRTLVLVDLELGVVDVRDFVNGHYALSALSVVDLANWERATDLCPVRLSG